MAGFANLPALIANLKNYGNFDIVPYFKATTLADAAKWGTLFFTAGLPPAASALTAGLGSAVACSDTTTGAIKFAKPVAGKKSFLTKWSVSKADSGTTTTNCLLLVDRLAHARVAINQASGNFSPVIDATARLPAASAGAYASGGMIVIEVASALGASNIETFSLTYTNEGGTGSKVTTTISARASLAANTVFAGTSTTAVHDGRLFVPLAAGDVGVRSIETWTKVAGSQTGEVNVSIVKPIAFLGQFNRGAVLELDQAIQYPNMVNIHDNACLALYSIHGTNNVVGGNITLAQA